MANSFDTNQLLQTLIAEVQGLRSSQAALESKLEAATGAPHRRQSSISFAQDALSISPPSHALPPPIPIPSSSVHPHSILGPSPTFSAIGTSASGNAAADKRRTKSGFEDEGSLRERARFAEWMRGTAGSPPNALASSPSFGPVRKDGPYTQRVILTTYPGQTGIEPIPLHWGAPTAEERGPVVASRHPQSLKIRNAIGAYSGSYCIYKALAAAIGAVDPNHRPDFTNTEPPFDVLPNKSWFDPKKIVSMDPWGHLTPKIFKSYFDAGVDIRPTIACTRAHLKVAELDEAVRDGRMLVDGKIVTRTPRQWSELAAIAECIEAGGKWETLSSEAKEAKIEEKQAKAGVEVAVWKAAVEPVWNLPGVAERFGIPESTLRRALFEDTGGMYPELLTRHDLKTFLPPIGGLTVYIFGDPAFVSDPTKKLTLRIHDECNGSDVFGSDICTCRPYLLYGIEQAVACAQQGGSGVVIYFRKEGRALGEVTKYLVYNARKRALGGDSAAAYFTRTENIAGVKDMRFQALMPDVLHWLGIQKIDTLCSMSDMKHDAIVGSGITVDVRRDLPEHLIPPDSRVEIDAKIAAGYFSASKTVTKDDLVKTVGRGWEDVEH